jgi:hypothetical protein
VWERFTSQFVYTKDGRPQDMEFTPEFLDEVEEPA